MSAPVPPIPEEGSPAHEIYQQFRGAIITGQLGRGERLPAVRQVARDLGVAPGTAAKAYRMLEQDGLVTSRTGAGTRVSEAGALLDAAVVERLRSLVELATERNARQDDVISALRNLWRSP